MTKTGQQIEDDVFESLTSALTQSNFRLSGSAYKYGTRPKDSVSEDAVVRFVAGLDDQIQGGTVAVNVYVPDIILSDGNNVRNITRCSEVESFGLEWSESLPDEEYRFTRVATIQTYEEPEIKQHFISIRLKYERPTF